MVDLEENLNIFIDYLKTIRGYSPSSLITYRNIYNELLKDSEFYEEEKVLTLDITPLRVNNRENSKKTISKKLSAIRSFVKFMREQKMVEIKLIGDSVIKVPKTLPKPIDENIIDAILKDSTLQKSLIVVMLYGLGLRISELSRVKIVDISKEWIKVTGKGSKDIENYSVHYKPVTYLLEKGGEQMNTNQIRYLFNKALKKSGIKATPHQLRHSFATHRLHNGARISDVSELLGYSSMVSTQIYTQLGSSKKLNEYSNAHPLCQENNRF